jgi:hypothetical protein
VLVGENDEAFYAQKFASVFKTPGKDVPVMLLPEIDHISLTLDPAAIEAAIKAVESMDHEAPNRAMERTADCSYVWLTLYANVISRSRIRVRRFRDALRGASSARTHHVAACHGFRTRLEVR